MKLWHVLGIALLVGFVFASSASADLVLDGDGGAAYGSALASDASGDLASPGPADWTGTDWCDVTDMFVMNSADSLWIHLDLPDYTEAGSSGQFGLTIDINNTAAGGTTDPWGQSVTLSQANLPDVFIRGNIVSTGDNGWTELRLWDGSDWDDGAGVNWGGASSGVQVGTQIAWSDNDGLELAIPFADIGISAGDVVNLEFYTTQAGPGKGAYDTVPGDDQSTGWDDPTTQVSSTAYTITAIPEPGTAILMLIGCAGAFFSRKRR